MSTTFRILSGLPPYGPSAVQFSPDGSGIHREGLVIGFSPGTGDWIGNFQRGGTAFDAVVPHPDGMSVIVVAGGQGYIVAPSRGNVTMMFGGDITGVVVAGPEQLVLSTFTDFRAFGSGGPQWRTRRISCDGFRSLRVEGGELRGEACTYAGDMWVGFGVQLGSGETTGGAYPRSSEGM